MRLSSFDEIGSQTVRRCTAPQPVFKGYKLLEIERTQFALWTPLGHREVR
jgi:hypothetical protein